MLALWLYMRMVHEELGRVELCRVGPYTRVHLQLPQVHEQLCARRYSISGHPTLLGGFPWHNEGSGRREPKRLLNNGMEVDEVIDVRFIHIPIITDMSVQLRKHSF